MQGRIQGSGSRTRYLIDGKEVTKEAFHQAFPVQTGQEGGQGLVGFKPLHSEALCVHPDQIDQATRDAKSKGVPTEFDPLGRPVFTSSRHFRDYARIYGFRHKGY